MIGEPTGGEALVGSLQNRMDSIEGKAPKHFKKLKTESPIDCPRVTCIEWIDPLMAAGNWIPELVEMGGGENVFGEAGQHSPWITWEALCKADPDIIVIMPCGYDISQSRRNIPVLTAQPEWSKLKSVSQGKGYITDGNQYFNRPGPRLAESLEIMAQLVDLKLFRFDFSHDGIGWELFPSFPKIPL